MWQIMHVHQIKSELLRWWKPSSAVSGNSSLKVVVSKKIRSRTLRKLDFHFLSHSMGYDRGDSFSFNFEPNGIQSGSKSKVKLSPRSYPIQCERKWKSSFLVYLYNSSQRTVCYVFCMFRTLMRCSRNPR